MINETLRLYSPAGRVARECVKPVEVAGYRFTPGMCASVNIFALHRNTEYWGLDAHEFRPERWLEPGVLRHPFQFIPFGAGPRICPGMNFARQEMRLTLLRVMYEFRLEAKEGMTKMPTAKETFTIGPKFPVVIVPVKRWEA